MSEFDAATQQFQNAISIAATEEAVWQALKDYAGASPGFILFTVTTVDMQAGLARRAFTSHPAEYPVSGTKPIHRDSWFELVHEQKQCFVANTIEDIAKVFPDHELIASLGCGSVINLPIVIRGEVVATVNLLAHAHHYTPKRVAAAQSLLPVPSQLCWALAALFDRGSKRLD